MWWDWVEGNDWTFIGTPNIRETYGGWFHVYAFTMTLGIILAIAYSFYKFKKQKLASENLIWGAAIIVPISLFGASFFGKLNAAGPGQNAGGVGFWGLFAFWQAGMSIHGGVLFGLIAGLVIFGLVGRKPKISLWKYVDAIVPNILLGQVVGRWGNFFNHELVGAPLYKIGTIAGLVPDVDGHFIDFNKLLQMHPEWNWPKTFIGQNTLAYNSATDEIFQMMPIFLIESLALLALWLIITFVVPNIGKWFGPKPWKVQSNLYHLTPLPSNPTFVERVKTFGLNSRQRHQIWNEVALNKTDPGTIVKAKPGTSRIATRWNEGQALIDTNNPHHYWLTKVGCEGAMYFFGWNLVRFLLEMSRPDDHLFIMYDKTLSLVLIGVMAFIGLVGMVVTQIGIPQLTRRQNWYYEQNYLYGPMTTTVLEPNKPKVQIEQ